MLPERNSSGLASAAFFCPQARAPDEDYLAGMHSFLSEDKHGQMLLREIVALKTEKVWTIFADVRADVAALSQGPEYVDMLHDWAAEGIAKPLAEARSGIVALPLLLVLQITQYLRYLAHHGLSHQGFLASVGKAGGIQGYCGGLPSAMAIACAKDEAEVIKHTATAMRIVLGVGAYGEAADDTGGTGSTTLAMRLKYEGQGDDLTRRFPGTHVSAITEPRSVSIVGPAGKLHELYCFSRDQEGVQVQKMEVRGKVHNPDNKELAVQLARLCSETPSLQLPDASQLQVHVRSNRSGERLVQGSLADELVTTILASRCEWYNLLGECGIRPTKTAAHGLIRTQKTGKLPTFPDNALAVVGASCRLPGARNLEELWAMLASGTDRHQELPTDRFDLHGSFRAAQSGSFTKGRTFYGNLIDDVQRFDNAFFGVSAREAANMDPQQRILLELAHEALEDSGYLATHHREDGDNVGCFIGASFVEYLDNTNGHAPTAYTSTGTIRAFLCGRLSYYFGWSGPAEVIDTACSSSLVAINRACKAVQNGECRMALTGGINIITGINNYLDLAKAGFLSPTGQCKPFDAAADGYCRSDGAGLVVIKKLKHAIADGDPILGVIPGVATNQGGLSASITVPHSVAQQALYRSVLEQARLAPETVTYVEAHGTGTQAGDPLEIESVRSIFARKSSDSSLYVGSIKGNIGHCETAAGVAGLLKILAMIKHGKLPPQANHNKLNPKIAPLEPDGLAITRTLRVWDVPFRAALVNSYGAAGSNCALLCCEMPSRREAVEMAKSDDIALPLLLGAASEKSLVNYARTLAAYLRQQQGELDLTDFAFTLTERRRRYKFSASVEARSIEHAAQLLESLEPAATFQPPQDAKPIVLLLSGQYDNKVGLDRSFYDRIPAFRYHVDAVDSELKTLGYPSILPAIFETQALDNVVTLQCGIFAMQYACAQSWMDAGLRPSAIVGHSLGELTALAICGALSLSDALKLVAARASLIEAKVGPEKGAMLALSACSTEEFEHLSSLLRQQQPSSKLEIACYNAPNALVVAGTTAAVDAAEELLRTDPRLQPVRVRRLATTHAFHSALMDPILTDLTAVAQSLEWREPKVPIEVSALRPLGTISEYSPSSHARDAVYFSEAIRRVEDRLGGSAVWLEAGVDTPVVAMATKAVRHPETHMFLAMKTQGSLKPTDVIAGVSSRLWRSGHFASHWRVTSRAKAGLGCKPIWLPPYQFEPTRHWLPNVDRVIEMQQTMASNPPAAALDEGALRATPLPPKLVTRRNNNTAAGTGVVEFTINTKSDRYRKIVGGHAVRSRPLCPASMYMECVTMALQLLLEGSHDDPFKKGASLVFEDLTISAPLGREAEGEVVLQLEPAASGSHAWKFAVRTLLGGGLSAKPRATTHGNGVITVDTNPTFDAFQRLVSGPMARVEGGVGDHDAERLMLKRAYSLFGRVVDYAPFFKAIRSVTLSEQEAVAAIRLPEDQPGREETTAWKICDTVAVDAFIQVVGLLMNSDDSVAADEVVVMVGQDRVVLSPAAKMNDPPEYWRVYAKFGYGDNRQPIGDVFVCTAQGDLVAIFTGCRFAKLPIAKLEKMLDTANRQSSPASATQNAALSASTMAPSSSPSSATDSSSVSTTTEDRGTITPATSTGSPPAQGNGELLLALRDMIAEYTGIGGSETPDDKILADLGVDSLASAELVGELSSKFGIDISPEELVESTLRDLFRHLGGTQSPPVPVSVTPASGMPPAPVSHSMPTSAAGPDSADSGQRFQKFLQILVEVTGVKPEDVKLEYQLGELGLDSLSSIDLKQELEDKLMVRLDDLAVDDTVESLLAQLGIAAPGSAPGSAPQNAPSSGILAPIAQVGALSAAGMQEEGTVILENPFEVLRTSDEHFDRSAQKNNFVRYWSDVAPAQNELMLAYIIEAFATLGVDLTHASPGDKLAQIPYQKPKHDKVVTRLWEILQNHGYVSIDPAGGITRGNRALDGQPSAQLQTAFVARFPGYKDEAALMGLTGPKLAACLSGQLDAVSLMFGSSASMKIMENYYSTSPMISTLTDQLVVFMTSLLGGRVDKARPVRILEVGAGTGGTTKRLAAALASAGVSARYTFTDISPSLVAKAKNALKQYPWIEYATFNMEKETPEALRGKFDVVIGTNCVHATSNRTASCRRLRETLTPGGIIVLSEVTQVIDWYDIAFGLLDGWWLAEGGTAYPIQPPDTWMTSFATAGFVSASCSLGPTRESTSQQLLVACNKHWDVPAAPAGHDGKQDGITFRKETMIYKEESGVQIHADVFFPTAPSASPMPIVVVGWSTGGHLAMSIGWAAEDAGIPPPTAVLSFYAPYDFVSGAINHLFQITNYDNSAKGDTTDLGWVRPGDPRSELVLALFKERIGLPLLLNGLPPRTSSSSYDTDPANKDQEGNDQARRSSLLETTLTPPPPALVASISPLSRLRAGQYRTPTFLLHGTADEVAPFAGAERFAGEMAARGVRHGLLAVRGAPHIYDLGLQPGTREWEERVAPGYRFLVDLVSLSP
ncbi:BcPKS16, polyketide synthase [Corynascus novoguineensis]|uniref:BcPKS16, polyketide synthase n=1 Tax=Corynascus novoguineensis TaxID=1126955 RepID=A0AAN7CMG1_9PEZI|nr:BcPKS16, polyketide synthase [Corynascus novoguineensis]